LTAEENPDPSFFAMQTYKDDDYYDDGSSNSSSSSSSSNNHFKITQTIPEQHTGKAQNWGNTKNSHIGHCTHTMECTNLKVQNIFHG
jgi:hypothetical protein